MFKFLHAADIHLDSPLRGLERYDGAPVEQIRQATRRALDNLVLLALDEKVQFVLIAGDLYDGNWKDYNTGLYFVSQMARLADAGIRVFAIAGNHDAQNRMTRALRLPRSFCMLPAAESGTELLDNLGVAIHGQSFASQHIWDDLSVTYPPAHRDMFNIGLLHTCATGSAGHDRYAPCTIEGLRAKGYDYWALGHVHERQILHTEPYIVFPGNIQGRHIREPGAKGCLLVTVQDDHTVNLDFRPLDVLRWYLCEIDASGVSRGDDLLEQIADRLRDSCGNSGGRLTAARIIVRGPSPLHEVVQVDSARWIGEIRARLIEVGGGAIWIEQVRFETAPARSLAPSALDGPLEELLSLLEQIHNDEEQVRQLGTELADLKRKLPEELKQGPDAIDTSDPAWLRGILHRVQPLLTHRLLSGDTAP